MTIYVIISFIAILVGMGISVMTFGTGSKRKKIFQDIYYSIEEVNNAGILYTKSGEYSAVLKMENPVLKYSGNTDAYYEFNNLITSIVQTLGEGYAIHKQDIFTRKEYKDNSNTEHEYLSDCFFHHFEGRQYIDSESYLVITQEAKKSGFFSYDKRKWKDFLIKIRKVHDHMIDAGINVAFLNKDEASSYVDHYFAMDFKGENFSMTGIKVDDETIGMGDRKCKIYSVVDVDCVNVPSNIRPFSSIDVNNATMPVDLLSTIDNIPEAQTIIYNQMIFMPNQKRELAMLDKKKNRHASIPNPSNQMAVEDVKKVQEVIARESKQLVYAHFNIAVVTRKESDIEKCTNYLENAFLRIGIHISKRAYNQLELFVNSFPGNCYGMNQDYDRFLLLSDAAACFMYKEHMQHSEDSELKIYYTNRQGVPVAIDISGKEGKKKLTDNSNFFCLGPSGSGKSFHMNTVTRQLWEQNTDIIIVDTGHSYEGLCEYVGGKYISYTKEKPITMNPFRIRKEEYNVEKIGFLKNLILLIWKGKEGKTSKTEERLIEQIITEYYNHYFNGEFKTLNFNSFFEFSNKRIIEICEENKLTDVRTADFEFLMKAFATGGEYERTLNEDIDNSLFDETFIVFEIDSISDSKLLFSIVTLIIMDLFTQKMRNKKNRKMLIIEEAWKAIASPMMAEYIKYLFKTARKFWASVGVVTQEIQDIVDSPIVKEAIINNSDVVMLLDQSKFKERFSDIKAILGLTDTDCNQIFTINSLENKEGRNNFKEVFIRRGHTGSVYGVEECKETYMTFTTERAEKDALKLYKAELRCNHKDAIKAYCEDWNNSGIESPLQFAQEVNKTGHVLNIPKS